MPMPKRPTAKKSISINRRPARPTVAEFVDAVRASAKIVRTVWPASHRENHDAMAERLRNAPTAGTPLTAEEMVKLEEAREDFRRGNFTVDPLTAHDRSDIAASRR